MTKQIHINVNIDLEQDKLIYKLLTQLSLEEIEEFIKQLDRACEQWGITENLYKYFKELHYQYIKECMEEYKDGVCPECEDEGLYVYDENDGFYIACRDCDWKKDL